MNNPQPQFLDALEALGKRFIHEFIEEEGVDHKRLQKDWYYSFHMLLSRLYYQGRSDNLSTKYLQEMLKCLDDFFLPNPTAKLNMLWERRHIPHDEEWTEFNPDESSLWNKFDPSMGKTRDREMVLDVLRYLYTIDEHNVGKRGLAQVKAGRIKAFREELMKVHSIGPKTSALFLRDVVIIYKCKLAPDEIRSIQPVDTWVKQVVEMTTGEKIADHLSIEEWFVLHGGKKRDAVLLNAGAWYLGKHSFKLALSLVAHGRFSPQEIEEMVLVDIDG